MLYGDITWTPFDTLQIGGRDYGAQALWVLGGLTLANGLSLAVFYKELKLSTFDTGLAAALGFTLVLLHYALMATVAVTTVGALSAVGAILVVALLIVPPATASLLTRRLPALIALSLVIGIAGALAGFFLAVLWDISISGMIAALLGAPQQGLVTHRATPKSAAASVRGGDARRPPGDPRGHGQRSRGKRAAAPGKELNWQPQAARRTIEQAKDDGLVAQRGDNLHLTTEGRTLADQVAEQ